MKHLHILCAALAILCSGTSLAQTQQASLPETAFNDKPTHIIIEVKNVPDSVGIVEVEANLINLFMNESILSQAERNGKRIYKVEMDLTPRMTSKVNFSIYYRKNELEKRKEMPVYVMHSIIGGGQKLKCVADMRRKEMKCEEGNFRMLNDEINKYMYSDRPYSSAAIIGKQGKEENDSVYLENILQRYHRAEAELKRRNASAPLLELWHNQTAYDIINRSKTLQVYRFDEQQYFEKKLFFLPLFEGNGSIYAYTEKGADLDGLKFSMEYFRKQSDLHLTDATEHYIEVAKLLHDAAFLTEAQWHRFSMEMPEYAPFFTAQLNHKKKYVQTEMPQLGRICMLDRKVENDSILPALMAQYPGRPLLVVCDWHCGYEVVSYIARNAKMKEKEFNTAFLDGPLPIASITNAVEIPEKAWRQIMRYIPMNHYLVMGYQYEQLKKIFFGETEIEDRTTFGFFCTPDGEIRPFLYKESEGGFSPEYIFSEISKALKVN